MNPMAILVVPSIVVVIGLILHSMRTRGGRDTAIFFGLATLFGVARGNIIWWITTVHFEGAFPYIFKNRLVGIYHDSFTADAGWIICIYIGAYLALRIRDRIPAVRSRFFALIALACLFNACFSYAIESTAIAMKWWQWTLSTKSSVLRDVPTTGIWAWFSVSFDFLMPFLLIRYYRRPGQWWPWLTVLIFPFHMWTHLFNSRLGAALPITPYGIYHWVMLIAVMLLPFVSKLELRRPWDPKPSGLGVSTRYLPFFGFGIVVSVLLLCDLGIHHEPGLLIAKLPLAFYALLALPAVPPVAVLGVAAVAAAVGGSYLIVPLLSPLAFFLLRGVSLWPRRPWLRIVYVMIPLSLTLWHYDWNRDKDALDRQYWSAIQSGDQLARSDGQAAVDSFLRATQLKPYSMPAYDRLVFAYTKMRRLEEAERILDQMLELRPLGVGIHSNYGSVKAMQGDYDASEEWFRKALAIDPKDAYSIEMLGNLDRMRAGASFKFP